MPFNKNDVVVLLNDKPYPDIFIPAGTLGTVVAPIVSMAASLVLFGIDTTTRLVPDSDLRLVSTPPAAAAPKAAAGGKKTAKVGFVTGDRVALTEDRDFGDTHLEKGSEGTVLTPLPTLFSSLVDFDAVSTDHVVPDSVLKKV